MAGQRGQASPMGIGGAPQGYQKPGGNLAAQQLGMGVYGRTPQGNAGPGAWGQVTPGGLPGRVEPAGMPPDMGPQPVTSATHIPPSAGPAGIPSGPPAMPGPPMGQPQAPMPGTPMGAGVPARPDVAGGPIQPSSGFGRDQAAAPAPPAPYQKPGGNLAAQQLGMGIYKPTPKGVGWGKPTPGGLPPRG